VHGTCTWRKLRHADAVAAVDACERALAAFQEAALAAEFDEQPEHRERSAQLSYAPSTVEADHRRRRTPVFIHNSGCDHARSLTS
jgi:hypothetical protein